MEPLTALVLSLLMWLTAARGELRCYCTDASCVSTGYMCKSALGKCYSLLTYDPNQEARSIHGCTEFLPEADRLACQEHGDVIRTRNQPAQWPILICCKDDMCNYMESLDINISVYTPNGSKPVNRGTNPVRDGVQSHLEEGVPQQRDLWFKAAVIAVPIAGGFILVLLVLLAVRMLRSDSRRHRQLMQMRRHRSLTKAQLYVADHFTATDCRAERHSHCNPVQKQNNQYKDVNIRIDYDGHAYEKMTNSSVHGGSCNSIIVWGKPGGKPDSATVV